MCRVLCPDTAVARPVAGVRRRGAEIRKGGRGQTNRNRGEGGWRLTGAEPAGRQCRWAAAIDRRIRPGGQFGVGGLDDDAHAGQELEFEGAMYVCMLRPGFSKD